MIYPGAESSIRFEKMREGIVDYEKIKLLKAKAADQQILHIKTFTRSWISICKYLLLKENLTKKN